MHGQSCIPSWEYNLKLVLENSRGSLSGAQTIDTDGGG